MAVMANMIELRLKEEPRKWADIKDKKHLQGFVMSLFPPELRGYYHDGGRKLGRRIYREYMFSEPILRDDGFSLYLRVRDDDGPEVVDFARKKGVSAALVCKKINTEEILYSTLSPIFVRRTLPDGRKVYPLPGSGVWLHLVRKNLARKCRVFGVEGRKNAFIKVVRYWKSEHRYDNWVYPVWHGIFEVRAPLEVHRVIMQAGLGSRNAQGCGMVWPVGERKR